MKAVACRVIAAVAVTTVMLAATGTVASAAVVQTQADPRLESATVRVDVDDEGTARVEAMYTITATGTEPASTVSFSALAFGSSAVDDVEASTADGQRLDTSVETAKLKTTATTTLPGALEPGAELQVGLRYTVAGAGVVDGETMTAEIPVMTPDMPTSATEPGLFTASVALPAGHQYLEGFPANPDQVQDTGDRTEIHYEVPTATALLRVVSTTGDAPLLTLERSMNLVLVAVLLLGGVALYYSFTRGRRRAAQLAATRVDGTPVDAAAAGTDRRH